jgi:4-hydroxybenzoate polyprenyltransferase
LAPVGAWIAVRGMVQMSAPLLLGTGVAFWVAGFDILYACQDMEFDKQAGLYSIPARVGLSKSLRIAALCHLVMFGMLVGLYFVSPHLGTVFLSGLICVGLLLMYEHSLVRADDLSRVNRAFFQVNGVISVGLLLLVLVQLAVK